MGSPWTEDLVGEFADEPTAQALIEALDEVTAAMEKPTRLTRPSSTTGSLELPRPRTTRPCPLEKCLAGVATKPLTAKMIEQLIDGLRRRTSVGPVSPTGTAAAERYLALVPL